VGLWAWLFHRSWKTALFPLALLGACLGLLLSASAFGLTLRLHGEQAFGLHFFQLADWYAPGLGPRLSLGLTQSYVFLQSVHYAVWLGWIPQEDTRAQGSVTFRMSWKALLADFRPPGLALVALGCLALPLLGLWLPRPSRDLYVSLATFHGYLELAVVAFLLTRGALPPRGASAAPKS
jgi:hypothetical protein